MIRLCVPLMIVGPVLASAQQDRQSVSQKTEGLCSPATVAGGSVTITCQGLDDEQRRFLRRLPKLIEGVLKRDQADRNTILLKLEEIIRLQREDVAAERQKHFEIEQRIAFRKVSDERAQAFKKEWLQFRSSTHLVRIDCQSEPEALKFAADIGQTLFDAGVKIDFSRCAARGIKSPVDFGIVMWGYFPDHSAVGVLRSWLESISPNQFTYYPVSGEGGGAIASISVGLKMPK